MQIGKHSKMQQLNLEKPVERLTIYLLKNNNSNSKRLFSYIKSKQIDNIGVAPLKDNGLVYINGHDKARILNSQFVNVFSIDKGDIPQIHAKYAENPMNNFKINSEGIIKLLNESQ